jgi:hypothetical protein
MSLNPEECWMYWVYLDKLEASQTRCWRCFIQTTGNLNFGMWWNEFYVRFHSMRGNAWGCEGIKDFTIFSSGCISLVTVGWVFFYPETVLMINFASKDFGLVMFWKGYYWYHFCQLGFTYFLLRSQVVTASSLTCLQLRLPWILSSSPSLMNHDHRKLSSIVGENIE